MTHDDLQTTTHRSLSLSLSRFHLISGNFLSHTSYLSSYFLVRLRHNIPLIPNSSTTDSQAGQMGLHSFASCNHREQWRHWRSLQQSPLNPRQYAPLPISRTDTRRKDVVIDTQLQRNSHTRHRVSILLYDSDYTLYSLTLTVLLVSNLDGIKANPPLCDLSSFFHFAIR